MRTIVLFQKAAQKYRNTTTYNYVVIVPCRCRGNVRVLQIRHKIQPPSRPEQLPQPPQPIGEMDQPTASKGARWINQPRAKALPIVLLVAIAAH